MIRFILFSRYRVFTLRLINQLPLRNGLVSGVILSQMCLTETSSVEQEQFVESAVKKQQRNKRKRKPNMFVAAVLECTVRRICSEVCSSNFCVCTSLSKRTKLDLCEEPSKRKTTGSSSSSSDERRDIAHEKQVSSNAKSSGEYNEFKFSSGQEITAVSENPQRVPTEESQVEEFLHSLTTELTDFPTFDDVDELLREIDGDSSDLNVWEDEIETLLNTNASDNFHPGLFEVLFR